MAFKNRREILFVYSVRDANPNGDPLNGNSPRMDEETGRILVSDVRVKRTIRDQWMREGKTVFVDGEAETPQNRLKAIMDSLKVSTVEETLRACIDARLFGVVCPIKNKKDKSNKKDDKEENGDNAGGSLSWCGPVQFKWGRSLHKAKENFVQGTAAFASQEGKDQRSWRNEYIVPFCAIGIYGVANQYASERTGATEDDLASLLEALWKGTQNLISRSKVGHEPLFLMEVKYKDGFDGCTGLMDRMVRVVREDGTPLGDDEELRLRSLDGMALDLSCLSERLCLKSDFVESLKIVRTPFLRLASDRKIREEFGGRFFEEER